MHMNMIVTLRIYKNLNVKFVKKISLERKVHMENVHKDLKKTQM